MEIKTLPNEYGFLRKIWKCSKKVLYWIVFVPFALLVALFIGFLCWDLDKEKIVGKD